MAERKYSDRDATSMSIHYVTNMGICYKDGNVHLMIVTEHGNHEITLFNIGDGLIELYDANILGDPI